ncbi:hypothetical protein [Nonomuraea africana]|uniref:Disulfide bond formation protein B n=1 Tax=Nonomuraea africana TaxID=46171 RepID=A0ABR9K6Z8_9ACTN|nr:hypothetical protein [Nonomuraea africana]MBE1557776.1 hypothetical protein [Nonomuraea africana]
MWGTIGRVAAIYASLGALWWVAINATRTATGCGDWPCLYPTLGAYLLVTVVTLLAAVPLLRRVDVGRAPRVALAAAAVLLAIRGFGEAVPASPSQVTEILRAGLAFTVAGTAGAVLSAPGLAARWRVLGWLVVLALPAAGIAVLWSRYGF